MGVVHNQHVGFKDDVAFEMNKIPGAYCAPRANATIVLDNDLHLTVSFDVEFRPTEKPSVLPDRDAIAQPKVRREASRNLTRIVERKVAALARERVRCHHPEAV